MKKVAIEESWASLMNDEFEKDYFVKIRTFLRSEYTNKTIFPHPTLIFNAFNLTPVSNVKVVISKIVEINIIINETLNSSLKKKGKLLFALFCFRTLFIN